MKKAVLIAILFVFLNFAVFSQTKGKQNSLVKFDEFERLTECEEGARLDNFLIELSKNKNSKGMIIFRSNKERENHRRMFRVDSYLYFRKVDRTQISYVIDNNDNPKIELWIAFENGEIEKCKNCKVIKAAEFKNPIFNEKETPSKNKK